MTKCLDFSYKVITFTLSNKNDMSKNNKDLSIHILDKLVESGYIKDCTDTDDNTEWEVQDIIEEVLNKFQPNNKSEE